MRFIGTLLIALLASSAASRVEAQSADIRGTWRGSFTCAQETTPLELRMGPAQGGGYAAIFEFGVGEQRGVYQMSGRMTGGEIVFTPSNWLRRPEGYEMVGLRGRLSGETFSGRVTNPRCGAFSTTKVSADTLPAPRPRAPNTPLGPDVAADAPSGRWSFDSVCRGQRVKTSVRISRGYDRQLHARVHMAPFDGDRTTSLIPVASWDTVLASASNDMMRFDVLLDSAEKLGAERGRRFDYYPVVFSRGSNGWTGRIEDPSCGAGAILRPEGPPPMVGESGRALTVMVWAGKSPFDAPGGQNLFQFLRVDPGVFLTAAERSPEMRWAPAIAAPMGIFLIACNGGGDCGSDPMRRVFYIEDPPSRFSPTQANFGSATGPRTSQWCKYNALVAREWRCTAIPHAFPASLTPTQLRAWMEAAAREEGAKWSRANPAPGIERCAVQTINGREERRVCQPVPGPPMPTYRRQ